MTLRYLNVEDCGGLGTARGGGRARCSLPPLTGLSLGPRVQGVGAQPADEAAGGEAGADAGVAVAEPAGCVWGRFLALHSIPFFVPNNIPKHVGWSDVSEMARQPHSAPHSGRYLPAAPLVC